MNQQENYLQQMLVTLRTRLLVMCASVGIALEEADKALAANDPGRAAAVIESDAAIDELENDIDDMALRLLARTQPVAGDLRFVVRTCPVTASSPMCGSCSTKPARPLSRPWSSSARTTSRPPWT